MRVSSCFLASITLVIGGCSLSAYRPDPVKQALAQASIPACHQERECAAKWSAAKKWVMTNSPYKVRLLSEDFIETFAATGGSSLISARVSKEPTADGYRFVVGVWCDNMFGCNPDAWDAAVAFNREVGSVKGF